MSPQPDLSFSTDLTVLGIVIPLLLILVVIPLLIFLGIKLFRSASPGLLLGIAAVIGSGCLGMFLVLYLSLAVPPHAVVVDQSSGNDARVQIAKAQPSEIPLPAGPLVAPKPQAAKTPSKSVAQPKQPEALPEWVQSGLKHSRETQSDLLENSRLVFESGLYTTQEEALHDSLVKASFKLQQNLQAHYPVAKTQISPEQVRHSAIRRTYYQTVEHDFGDVLKTGEPLKQKMYRAYVEVEDSPAVRKIFFTKWKLQTGNRRVAWLGGAFGLITALCVGVSLYLRSTQP